MKMDENVWQVRWDVSNSMMELLCLIQLKSNTLKEKLTRPNHTYGPGCTFWSINIVLIYNFSKWKRSHMACKIRRIFVIPKWKCENSATETNFFHIHSQECKHVPQRTEHIQCEYEEHQQVKIDNNLICWDDEMISEQRPGENRKQLGKALISRLRYVHIRLPNLTIRPCQGHMCAVTYCSKKCY